MPSASCRGLLDLAIQALFDQLQHRISSECMADCVPAEQALPAWPGQLDLNQIETAHSDFQQTPGRFIVISIEPQVRGDMPLQQARHSQSEPDRLLPFGTSVPPVRATFEDTNG